MIISHKHKFIFIGLPFSASSAISKELHLQYQGEPFLRKHSLYNELDNRVIKKEFEYFVFAVLRNPMDIVVTVYEKMRANSKGNFTNSNLFVENGGYITKNQRKAFNFIHDNNATFQEYFKEFFQKPYDNLASLTLDNCDYIIRYENIADDYLTALKKIGIKTPKDLPIANQTAGKKKNLLEYYTDDIQDKAIFVFGPFLQKYNYLFPESWGEIKPSIKSKFLFRALGFFRKLKQRHSKKSIVKFGPKGSIYGDMQRNQLKR